MSLPISVVIPNYNRAHTLPRAIDSVLRQDQACSEVIVVDDGSVDNTVEVISQRYPEVKLLNQTHAGVSCARNLGIKHATQAWVAFLDSDDEWEADKLRIQYQLLMDNEGHFVIHSNERWLRNGKPLKQLAKHKKRGGFIYQHCLPLCVISPSSVIIHKTVFEQTGLFDEALPVCEDYDMWLRICSQFSVLYSEKVLTIKHGGHSDQLSHQYWGMDRFRILAMAKILKSDTLAPQDRLSTVQMSLKKIDIYTKGAEKHGNSLHLVEFAELRQRYIDESERELIP